MERLKGRVEAKTKELQVPNNFEIGGMDLKIIKEQIEEERQRIGSLNYELKESKVRRDLEEEVGRLEKEVG